MKILFGACSLGLGHATRDLPLINKLLSENHEITIVSTDRALTLLKKELGNQCKYIDLPEYKLPYTKKKFSNKVMLMYFPHFLKQIVEERKKVQKILAKNKYQRLISDCKFGVCDKTIPSFLINHQLRFLVPGRIMPIELITEGLNKRLKYFNKFIVPDYKENSLTGDLSHKLKLFKKEQLEYIGILSGIQKQNTKEDIDYFISSSGPEPQRTIFEKKVFDQVKNLKGNVVITKGKPEAEPKVTGANIKVYDYLNREKQAEIMNRSKLIVSRSGYTTMMELAELGKKALLIPTEGQPEQEYLSKYHNKLKTYLSVKLKNLDLKNHIEEAKKYSGYNPKEKTKEAVEKFMQIVS